MRAAQKNNPKAVVLIERARRIKFDDSDRHRLCDVAGFCKQLAKTGSPISASGDGADDDGQAERAGDRARLRWQ